MSQAVLVTGGTGFIGAHLATELLERGHRVTVLGRSPEAAKHISDKELRCVSGAMEDVGVTAAAVAENEVIFHKASSYGRMPRNAAFELFHNDIAATQGLIDTLSARKHRVRMILFDSSAAVYGEGNYGCGRCGIVRPAIRTAASVSQGFEPRCPGCGSEVVSAPTPEGARLNGVSSYALSKKVQEEMLMSFCLQQRIALVIFRYSSVFGAGARIGSTWGWIAHALKHGIDLHINEDGKQRREFVFTDDVVRANILALDSNLSGCHIFNVSSQEEVPLLEFVEYAKQFGPYRSAASRILLSQRLCDGDVRSCRLSCEHIQQVLGFSVKTSIVDGLKSMYRPH